MVARPQLVEKVQKKRVALFSAVLALFFFPDVYRNSPPIPDVQLSKT
jgi:hypothetical protein